MVKWLYILYGVTSRVTKLVYEVINNLAQFGKAVCLVEPEREG